MTTDLHRPQQFFGPGLVYARTASDGTNDIIEDTDEIQFANGQSGRDLQVSLDAGELQIQFNDSINNVGGYFRNGNELWNVTKQSY
jgi:hypothetical protein